MRGPWSRLGVRVRALSASDRADALRILRAAPETSILAAVHLDEAGRDGAQMLGVERDGELNALCWMGANTVPVGDSAAMAPLAAHLRRRGRRSSSIVGSADLVEALWAELRQSWMPAREIRAVQPALRIDGAPAVAPHPHVRRARVEDFGALFPAAVAMFTEEVGYDPTRAGAGYAQYVRSLVASERSWIVAVDGVVIFKADVGALWEGIAQVQGVWVHPEWRGRGIGTSAMAGVVQQIRAELAPAVSLYVNDYNTAARRVYEKVGFRRVGTYATILF